MNLLVTGAWDNAKDNIGKLEELGHSIVYMQKENESLPCEHSWVEGVICNGFFLYHPIEMFVNLKYIQVISAGLDRIPIDYVYEHSIVLHNAKDVYSIPMAEFAIAGVLQLYKQIDFFRENQQKHCWEKHRGLLELYNKTVCIVGCGSVGTECAKRFKAFGCNVIGVNRTVRKDDNYKKMVSIEKLDNVLLKADILVLSVPLTDQTRYLMNSERFGRLKNGAVLVNISRGAVVDTGALIKALPLMKGAVLDVFEEEPLDSYSDLWDMKNVIITPHNSFVGEGNGNRLSNIIIENIIKSTCEYFCI